MKLAKLIDLYNQTLLNIEKQWNSLINAAAADKTSQYPSDNTTYPVGLTVGEILLSKIIQKYEELDDMVFYIYDAKSKVKVPEFGISISCAEEELKLLNHKLFNHTMLGKVAGEIGFKVIDVDTETNDVGVELTDLNKGFDLAAIDDTLAYLKAEIKKYQACINKVLDTTEVVFPFNEDKKNISVVDIPAKKGTPKKNPQQNVEEEVDWSEYVNAKDFVENPSKPVKKPEKVQSSAFKGCQVCNSAHRENIETFFNDTEGNMMQTLEFASSDCGLPSLSPNNLLTHLEHHVGVAPKPKRQSINSPDKHTSFDHAFMSGVDDIGEPIVNPARVKNLAKNAYNPDEHNPMDHAQE